MCTLETLVVCDCMYMHLRANVAIGGNLQRPQKNYGLDEIIMMMSDSRQFGFSFLYNAIVHVSIYVHPENQYLSVVYFVLKMYCYDIFDCYYEHRR